MQLAWMSPPTNKLQDRMRCQLLSGKPKLPRFLGETWRPPCAYVESSILCGMFFRSSVSGSQWLNILSETALFSILVVVPSPRRSGFPG